MIGELTLLRHQSLMHPPPALQAAIDDSSPAVRRVGLVALQRLAAGCGRGELLWQRELLLDLVKRVLVGCDSAVWPQACAAVVELVQLLEGKDPRAEGYGILMVNLLTEVEREAHEAARALPFLSAMQRLVPSLGLITVRHFARLMPLLLEWLHTPNGEVSLAACNTLAVVSKYTWPRMPAHAAVLKQHILDCQRVVQGQQQWRHETMTSQAQQEALVTALDYLNSVLDAACAAAAAEPGFRNSKMKPS